MILGIKTIWFIFHWGCNFPSMKKLWITERRLLVPKISDKSCPEGRQDQQPWTLQDQKLSLLIFALKSDLINNEISIALETRQGILPWFKDTISAILSLIMHHFWLRRNSTLCSFGKKKKKKVCYHNGYPHCQYNYCFAKAHYCS